MNLNLQSRRGWLKYPLLAVLAATGLTAGIYLSKYADPDTTEAAPLVPAQAAAAVQRFPLTLADTRDRNEAPELASDAGGRVYLLWASQTGPEERALFLSRSEPGSEKFANPKAVARSGIVKTESRMNGKSITRESKMAPHAIVHGEVLHLGWTESLPGNTGLRMVVATSTDHGVAFAHAIPVHQGKGARATYTALASGPDGTLLCSWLDNRNKSQEVFASLRRPGQDAFDPEQVVHAGDEERGVCPCCPTASLVGPDGACYVAFRNIAAHHRDIFIGRRASGAAHFELFPVVPPTWEFNGCPHDGASMAIVGDTIHVVWMDAHVGSPRCYYGSARTADLKFSVKELHGIAHGSQGNARICADATGALHVVWEESTDAGENQSAHKHDATPKTGGAGRAILYGRLSAGGGLMSAPRAVAPRAGAFQTRPSVVAIGDGRVVVAFNELDETGKAIVVATSAAEVRP